MTTMIGQAPDADSPSESTATRPAASPETSPQVPPANGQSPVNKLTPEEQLALFEKELKEEDWGHQPC